MDVCLNHACHTSHSLLKFPFPFTLIYTSFSVIQTNLISSCYPCSPVVYQILDLSISSINSLFISFRIVKSSRMRSFPIYHIRPSEGRHVSSVRQYVLDKSFNNAVLRDMCVFLKQVNAGVIRI